jgi:cell division protein FtsQ
LILKNIIDSSKFDFKDIKNLYYFTSRRWDIELSNDILIKLPKKNVSMSLELVFDFLSNNNFAQIKVIDARIKNQIILND